MSRDTSKVGDVNYDPVLERGLGQRLDHIKTQRVQDSFPIYKERYHELQWGLRRLIGNRQRAKNLDNYEKRNLDMEQLDQSRDMVDTRVYALSPWHKPLVEGTQADVRIDPNIKTSRIGQHVPDNRNVIRNIEKDARGELRDRTMDTKGNPSLEHEQPALVDLRLSNEDIVVARKLAEIQTKHNALGNNFDAVTEQFFRRHNTDQTQKVGIQNQASQIVRDFRGVYLQSQDDFNLFLQGITNSARTTTEQSEAARVVAMFTTLRTLSLNLANQDHLNDTDYKAAIAALDNVRSESDGINSQVLLGDVLAIWYIVDLEKRLADDKHMNNEGDGGGPAPVDGDRDGDGVPDNVDPDPDNPDIPGVIPPEQEQPAALFTQQELQAAIDSNTVDAIQIRLSNAAQNEDEQDDAEAINLAIDDLDELNDPQNGEDPETLIVNATENLLLVSPGSRFQPESEIVEDMVLAFQ